MHHTCLQSTIKQFEYYKILGEKTIEQLEDEALFGHDDETSKNL